MDTGRDANGEGSSTVRLGLRKCRCFKVPLGRNGEFIWVIWEVVFGSEKYGGRSTVEAKGEGVMVGTGFGVWRSFRIFPF